MTLILREQTADEYLAEVRQHGDSNSINNNGIPPLCVAIYKFRSLYLVEELLRDGADVNSVTSLKGSIYLTTREWYQRWGNFSPLHIAIALGQPEILRVLLDNGADPKARTSKGIEPLGILLSAYQRCLPEEDEVSEEKDLEILKLMVKNGSNFNIKDKSIPQTTLLHQAIVCNHREITRYLISLGCNVNDVDINGKTPLHYSTTDSIECARVLLENGANPNAQDNSGETVYHHIMSNSMKAAQKDPLEFINLLHDYHINPDVPNIIGRTALHFYFQSDLIKHTNGIEVIESVLKYGADPNIADEFDRTPVFYLVLTSLMSYPGVWKLMSSILTKLLQYGMSFNKRDITGQPLLHLLVKSCLEYPDVSYSIFKCTMVCIHPDHEVDVDIEDFQSRTALHLISAEGKWQFVEILLNHGANMNAMDCDGNTPLHVAIACKQWELSKKMLLWGLPNRISHENFEDNECFKSNETSKRLPRSKSISMEKDNDRKHVTPLGSSFQWTSKTLRPIAKYLETGNSLFQVRMKPDPTYIDILDRPNPALSKEFSTCINATSLLQACEKNSVGDFHLTGKCDEEKCAIAKQVFCFVKDLVEKCAEMDPRLESKLLWTGSTAEGTKMWKPDEFDFMMELTQLRDRCSTEGTLTSLEVILTKENRLLWSDLLLGEDNSLKLSPMKLKSYVTALLWKAALSLDRDRYPNIWYNLCQYYSKKDYFLEKTKVGVNFTVYWFGEMYKNLLISVDLTPAIPLRLSAQHKSMVREHAIGKCGGSCFHVIPYISIKHCGRDMWRTSFSLAEFEIIKSLSSEQIALYKCLKFLRDIYENGKADVPSYNLKMFLFNFFFLDELNVHRYIIENESFRSTVCRALRGLSNIANYPLDKRHMKHFFFKYSLDMLNYDMRWCKKTLGLLEY